MRLAVLLLALNLATGCAQTAIVKCWEPAEIDAKGIHRIVVIDFAGDQGNVIAASLSSRLWENNFYTLVDRSELTSEVRTASFSEGVDFQDLLVAAKTANVDGIIVGKVVDYRFEVEPLRGSDVGEYLPMDVNQVFRNTENAMGMESSPIPQSANATVTVSFRLIDVETGEVRATKQVSRVYRAQSSQQSDVTELDREQVLNKLMTECLDEIVQTLAPHESKCEMSLATCDFWTKGSGEVKAGLKSAAKGDWVTASQRWEAAVAMNPENHAALFNLSIAAARQQNYDDAEQYILDALKLEHKKCYTAGLEKIRERRSALGRANDQREARTVSSEESVWR